jgi:hypothetical protein
MRNAEEGQEVLLEFAERGAEVRRGEVSCVVWGFRGMGGDDDAPELRDAECGLFGETYCRVVSGVAYGKEERTVSAHRVFEHERTPILPRNEQQEPQHGVIRTPGICTSRQQ